MYSLNQYPSLRISNLLQQNPPLQLNHSILTTRRDPKRTTEKYTETDDLAVIETFNANGWNIVEYNEVKTRQEDRKGYQKYCAIYENPDLNLNTKKGHARLLQIGSHDGRSRLRLEAGFFTMACANGLICGDSLFQPVTIKHIGEVALQLDHLLKHFVSQVPNVFQTVEHMTQKQLSILQIADFAKQAAKIRFGDANAVPVNDIVQVRYQGQESSSVWDILNRAQANLIEKPFPGLKSTSPETQRSRQVRKVTNIDSKVKLNKDFWELAQTYVQ